LPTVIETHLEGRYDFLVFLSFEISLTLIFYGLVLCNFTAGPPVNHISKPKMTK